MTDSTDDDDSNQTDAASARTDDSQIPGDVRWEQEIQVPFDEGERHDLTSAIIVGIAKIEDVKPRDIQTPPLYEVLDVAALEESFFGSSTTDQRRESFRSVEFMYRGYRIVVRSDAWIQIYRPDEM